MGYEHYTTAELQLRVLRHIEGHVTLPSHMLKALKGEIARRKRN